MQWFRPATLEQLLALRHDYPQVDDKRGPKHVLVAGNSEIGECDRSQHYFSRLVVIEVHIGFVPATTFSLLCFWQFGMAMYCIKGLQAHRCTCIVHDVT